MCYVSKDGFTHLDGISWVLLNCVLCTLNGFEHIFRFITCKVPDKNVAAPFIIPVNHSLHPITGLKTPGCYAAHRLRTQRRVLPESRLSVLPPRAVSGTRDDPRATQHAAVGQSRPPPPAPRYDGNNSPARPTGPKVCVVDKGCHSKNPTASSW